MKTNLAEQFSLAITDAGIQLKNLDVDSYMKTVKLMKKVSVLLDENAADIQTLIKEYNKEFLELIKSDNFKDAVKKKTEALTAEEVILLETRQPVTLNNGILTGPNDFVEKIQAIKNKELKLEKEETNFISDAKIFKAFAENTSSNNQAVLFDTLFKK